MACLAALGGFARVGLRPPTHPPSVGGLRPMCLLDRDDELSKRTRRRPQRSVERLIVRAKLQHRLLMRAIADLELERQLGCDTTEGAGKTVFVDLVNHEDAIDM
jgi:hypothetical protein